jgi:hypothetical protein
MKILKLMRVLSLVLAIILVLVTFLTTMEEAKAYAWALTAAEVGGSAVLTEMGAYLAVAAGVGLLALTGVGAYALYKYMKSRSDVVYDAQNKTITVNSTNFDNVPQTISLDDVQYRSVADFYATEYYQTFKLGAIPYLGDGTYKMLYVFTQLPYQSGANKQYQFAIGGVVIQSFNSQYWVETQNFVREIQFTIARGLDGSIYVNGQKANDMTLTVTDAYRTGYHRIEYALRLSATQGTDYVLDTTVAKTIPLGVPLAIDDTLVADGMIDGVKIKDLIPALRDTAITEPTTTTGDITRYVPKDVPTDRISPPALSIPQLITQKFPFSLPWDYYRLLQMLDIKGEAFKYSFELFGVPMSIDFSKFESLILIFRKLLFLGFIFALLPKTVTLLKGGDN